MNQFLYNLLMIIEDHIFSYLTQKTACQIIFSQLFVLHRFIASHSFCDLIFFNYDLFSHIRTFLKKFKPPVNYYPLSTFTNYAYQTGRLLKRNCQHKVKQKAFFTSNVIVEAQGEYFQMLSQAIMG